MRRRRPPRPTRITERSRALLGIAVVAAALGCRKPADLPDLGGLPPFSLTDRSERKITARDLTGHVWVANFIFTRCPDVCPALTGRFARLQDRLAGGVDPIRLVSITVDPEHDTPAVLRDYASRAKAGPGWLFLTGPPYRVSALLKDGFKVAFANDGPSDNPITHSDRFVLVDRRLRIRGYYHGTDENDVARLARDAIALRDKPA